MKNFRTLFVMLLLAVTIVLIQFFGLITGRTSADGTQGKHRALESQTTLEQPRLGNQLEFQAAKDEPKAVHENRRAEQHQPVITWRGGRRDRRWSNRRNWEGGRVPGANDIARFTAHSKSDVIVDTHLAGGLKLEPGFHGAVKLNSDLTLSGDM